MADIAGDTPKSAPVYTMVIFRVAHHGFNRWPASQSVALLPFRALDFVMVNQINAPAVRRYRATPIHESDVTYLTLTPSQVLHQDACLLRLLSRWVLVGWVVSKGKGVSRISQLPSATTIPAFT